MKQIDRIQEMERCLDLTEEAVKKLTEALDVYEKNQKAIRKLFDYYGSTLWMKDYEDDEAGKLPSDLKRGVLSEDAVYDMITDHHEAILRMSRIITKAVEGKML